MIIFKKIFRKNESASQALTSLILGLGIFLLITGGRILSPRNLNWLAQGPNTDPIQAYLGWDFYRKSNWAIPLGQNPGFGELNSNSIAYSDSIPLLALPFKMIDVFLPSQFQYFGLWILICLVLANYFALKIISLFTSNRPFQILGSIITTFSPISLVRINLHLALNAQFLILAAIYIFLISIQRGENSLKKWMVLLFSSLSIHGYLFAISYTFFFFGSLRNVFERIVSFRRFCLQTFLVTLGLFTFARFVLGYSTMSPDGLKTNYWGIWGVNLFSFLYPNDWSLIFRGLPIKGNVDTAQYLGLGAIVCMCLGVLVISRQKREILVILQKYRYLIYSITLLTLFAVTNRVSVGNSVFEVPLPKEIIELFSIFRASARMNWPLLYASIIASIILILRYIRKKIALPVLLLCVALQVFDSYPGWSRIIWQNPNIGAAMYTHDFVSEWTLLAKDYDSIKVVPNDSYSPPGWPKVAIIASQFGLTTNAASLSRVNKREFMLEKRQIERDLHSGILDAKSIYVLTDPAMIKRGEEIVSVNSSHKLMVVDNLTLLLPNYGE